MANEYEDTYLTTNNLFFGTNTRGSEKSHPVNPGRWSEPPSFKGHRESRNVTYLKDYAGRVIPSVTKKPYFLPPMTQYGPYRGPPMENQPPPKQWSPPPLNARFDGSEPPSAESFREPPRQVPIINQQLPQQHPNYQRPRIMQMPHGAIQVDGQGQGQGQSRMWEVERSQAPPMSDPQSVPQAFRPPAQPQPPSAPQQSNAGPKKVFRAYIAPPPLEGNPAFRSKFVRKPAMPDWGRIPAAEVDSLLDQTQRHYAMSEMAKNRKFPLHLGRPSASTEYQDTIDKLGTSVIVKHDTQYKNSQQFLNDLEVRKRERLEKIGDDATDRAAKQMMKMNKSVDFRY